MRYLRHLARLGTPNIHPLGAPASRTLLSLLDAGPRDRLLEIGCGTGETLVLAAARSRGQAVGVERMPEMLAAARARIRLGGLAGRVALLLGDARDLPLATASCERVLVESVLGFQEAAAARTMLGEIRRVLVPGGRCVANEAIWKEGVDARTALGLYRGQVEEFGLAQASAEPWSEVDWTRVMREAGFEVKVLRPENLLAPAWPAKAALRAWFASKLVSRALRWRGLLSRTTASEERYYRDALARRTSDGALIEARFFLLETPRAR